MTTIFLNLGPRLVGGELLPNAPFRAFVKFHTPHIKNGGVAVLRLKKDNKQIGTAIIDWSKAEARRHAGHRGKYLVGSGSLDEYDLSTEQVFQDWQLGNLIAEAMKEAKWTFHCYDHGMSAEDVQIAFYEWIKQNL